MESSMLFPGSSEFKISKGYIKEEKVIPGDGHWTFEIKFVPREPFRYGILRCVLVVSGRNWSATHELKIEVSNEDELKMLAPTSAFKAREVDTIVRTIIPAFPPSRSSKTHRHTPSETSWVEQLGDYPIPENLQNDVAAYGRSSKFNPWKLRENYRPLLHNLLWLEEAQGVVNMRKFDIIETTLEPIYSYEENEYLVIVEEAEPLCKLYVPGLAEGRPSILQNDIVYVWEPDDDKYEYEGYVHRVGQNYVLLMLCLAFHQRLAAHPNRKYNVRFAFNRLPLRILHRAVDKADIKLVWPEVSTSLTDIMRQQERQQAKKGKPKRIVPVADPEDLNDLKWFDEKIAENKEQASAVKAIINRRYGVKAPPLLLFGAFGTGKTRTLVEAIKQILVIHPEETRILVCAPSNSAADAFAVQLADFELMNEKTLFRYYAFHRPLNSIPQSIHKFTLYNEEAQIFEIPPVASLMDFKIIVCTAHSSSTLFGVGVPKGHFTHVVLDEAAQMMEAEALVPLTLADDRSVIVMAGDYHQLGPHLVSPSSKLHGLDVSIMERMSKLDVYQVDKSSCQELVKNYRSHPAILKFASEQFYNDKLQALADRSRVNSLCKWKKLPNPNFPLLFCGVEGEDLQEGDSPSFFNAHEAIAIADLVEHLMDTMKISANDIGVIAPFRKQLQKIRQLLRHRRLGGVKVDSVSEMQGKEKRAIFISTVRASRAWQEKDRLHGIGFLGDVRRLNTAITRARCLLVVVGDPYALAQDKHWRALIMYCKKNNSYVGPELNPAYEEKREQEQKLREAAPPAPPPKILSGVIPDDHREEEEALLKPVKIEVSSPSLPSHDLPSAVSDELSLQRTRSPSSSTSSAVAAAAAMPFIPSPLNDVDEGQIAVAAPAQPVFRPPPVMPVLPMMPIEGRPLHPLPLPSMPPFQWMPPAYPPGWFPPAIPHHVPILPHMLPPPFHQARSAEHVPAPLPLHLASVPSAPMVEDDEESKQLAAAMMNPMPRPLDDRQPNGASENGETENEEDFGNYVLLYAHEGINTILIDKTLGRYPPLMVNETIDDNTGARTLTVQVSTLGLVARSKKQDRAFHISFYQSDEAKKAQLGIPSLHVMPQTASASGKKSKGRKGRGKPTAELARIIIAVPMPFHPSLTQIVEEKTGFIVTMRTPALATPPPATLP